ncbi:MAG TPA: hypothetical protein VFU23_03860 [Gemmatimonadales bacterium]|nr:hypothetical protein [Gemmatimonadales bacterium]
MVAGRGFWIAVWFGIMLLGLLGFGASIYWARETHWKNLDELLRAIGTIVVSTGMLLLLYGVATAFGQVLLVVALVCFILAFIFGRKYGAQRPHQADQDDEPEAGP